MQPTPSMLWFQAGWKRVSRKWHAAPADVMRPMTDPHVRLIYANFRAQGIARGPIATPTKQTNA